MKIFFSYIKLFLFCDSLGLPVYVIASPPTPKLRNAEVTKENVSIAEDKFDGKTGDCKASYIGYITTSHKTSPRNTDTRYSPT